MRADVAAVPAMPDPRGGANTSRTRTLLWFTAIGATTLLLRIFYSGHLYQDDGLWFTAAEEILRGKTLYRDIYFDKPPLLPFVYASLFKLFGATILAVRLFTIAYSLAVSVLLYLFARRLWDRRSALVAAGAFAVLATTYTTGHFQGLNTDFVALFPYALGALIFMRVALDHEKTPGFLMAFGGGAATGLAFQANPKSILNLCFFACLLFIVWVTTRSIKGLQSLRLISLSIAGFATAAAPLALYIWWSDAWPYYREYVWGWGTLYVGYHSGSHFLKTGLYQTANYFLLNPAATLSIALVAGSLVGTWRRRGVKNADRTDLIDFALLLWLAVSYLGVALGGRFFGHYFLQIVPAIALLVARGLKVWQGLMAGKSPWLRRVMIGILCVAVLFSPVRFHGRTAILTVDWVRGERSESTRGWFHDRLAIEEQRVASVVRGREDRPGDFFKGEAIREGGPGQRPPVGPDDYLFVWGYRPEIYFWSGLLPASKYLSAQALTGVPSDVAFFLDYRGLLDSEWTAAERARLVQELEATAPTYIVDELGFFNNDLDIRAFPETREFMRRYRNLGAVGRFFVYRKKKDPGRRKRKKARSESRPVYPVPAVSIDSASSHSPIVEARRN